MYSIFYVFFDTKGFANNIINRIQRTKYIATINSISYFEINIQAKVSRNIHQPLLFVQLYYFTFPDFPSIIKNINKCSEIEKDWTNYSIQGH